MKIEIKTIAFIATIELPAMHYTAITKALEYAVKNKFTKDIDIFACAKECLLELKEAEKKLN